MFVVSVGDLGLFLLWRDSVPLVGEVLVDGALDARAVQIYWTAAWLELVSSEPSWSQAKKEEKKGSQLGRK